MGTACALTHRLRLLRRAVVGTIWAASDKFLPIASPLLKVLPPPPGPLPHSSVSWSRSPLIGSRSCATLCSSDDPQAKAQQGPDGWAAMSAAERKAAVAAAEAAAVGADGQPTARAPAPRAGPRARQRRGGVPPAMPGGNRGCGGAELAAAVLRDFAPYLPSPSPLALARSRAGSSWRSLPPAERLRAIGSIA